LIKIAKFCANCGHELIDNNRCCSYCWIWHEGDTGIKPISNCRNCGRPLESGSSNCSYCWTWHKEVRV